jgi:acyl-coenzyme A thioesterase PaaI-like protein
MADGGPDAAAMTGLAFLQGIAQGTSPPAPIAELLGFRLCAIEAGQVAFEGRRAACHYNPIGTVHGGYATLEIKVNLMRPITAATGPVRAEGTLVHRGRRTATSEARLIDGVGRLLAHATCTCLLLPL